MYMYDTISNVLERKYMSLQQCVEEVDIDFTILLFLWVLCMVLIPSVSVLTHCVCLSLGWPAPLCRCTWSTCWTPSSTPTLRCDWRPYRWWCLFYSRDWCTLCRSVSYNTHPTELVDIYVSTLKEYICNCTTRLVQTLCQYPVNTRINKLVPNICHVQTFTCVH